ncbi:MAG: ABC transporter permease [Leptolyngbya sp. UWPOB_LEPTO1]|uniref:ABC transporter permease n=1 Tax=Leptolyngbya sp. UWPOB_LEPTO1 TaxID=2815653 RepID=UPI001AD255D6|nr:ABC transporter permease [Leptolyngbya sp. UWPOB_LEPTO1]MBN8564307.1 ABC transporter permease [Leptolyngbya sp. UWPOB_LEPTO1]
MSEAVLTIGGTFNRIGAIASNVFREVMRDRILYLVMFYAGALILANYLLPEIAATTEKKILLDLALATMPVIGLIVAIFIGTGLVNKEIEKRTVFVLIAKPVSRAEFIIGKHLGLSAVLAVLIAAMSLIAVGILLVEKIPFSLPNLLISSGFLLLQLSLISAIAILFGVFTSSLLAMMLSFGIYLMGQLSPDIVKFGKLTKNPVIETVTQGLYLVLPDLTRLDLKNQAVYNLIPAPQILLGNALYAFLYIAFVLTIASLIFSRREF